MFNYSSVFALCEEVVDESSTTFFYAPVNFDTSLTIRCAAVRDTQFDGSSLKNTFHIS